jgi:hypothetical protein
MDNISIVGIIVATLALFFLSAAWYTFLFGKQWRAEMGITEEQATNTNPSPMMFVVSIGASLLIAVTLAKLIDESSVGYGFKIGLGTGAGIGAAILAQAYVFEQRSLRFWLINAGFLVIGLTAMGTIIGAFQAA